MSQHVQIHAFASHLTSKPIPAHGGRTGWRLLAVFFSFSGSQNSQLPGTCWGFAYFMWPGNASESCGHHVFSKQVLQECRFFTFIFHLYIVHCMQCPLVLQAKATLCHWSGFYAIWSWKYILAARFAPQISINKMRNWTLPHRNKNAQQDSGLRIPAGSQPPSPPNTTWRLAKLIQNCGTSFPFCNIK